MRALEADGTKEMVTQVLRRIFYFFVLAVCGAVIWIRGHAYFDHVRVGLAGTTRGLLELGYLLIFLAALYLGVRNFLRSERTRPEAPKTGQSSEHGAGSFMEHLAQVQTTAQRMFVRRPAVAIVLFVAWLVICAGIPIALLAAALGGGVNRFGPFEWLLLGLVELPVLLVATFWLRGFLSGEGSSH